MILTGLALKEIAATRTATLHAFREAVRAQIENGLEIPETVQEQIREIVDEFIDNTSIEKGAGGLGLHAIKGCRTKTYFVPFKSLQGELFEGCLISFPITESGDFGIRYGNRGYVMEGVTAAWGKCPRHPSEGFMCLPYFATSEFEPASRAS
jgi:hypothetical protein